MIFSPATKIEKDPPEWIFDWTAEKPGKCPLDNGQSNDPSSTKKNPLPIFKIPKKKAI